jgi:hypothetical protein
MIRRRHSNSTWRSSTRAASRCPMGAAVRARESRCALKPKRRGNHAVAAHCRLDVNQAGRAGGVVHPVIFCAMTLTIITHVAVWPSSRTASRAQIGGSVLCRLRDQEGGEVVGGTTTSAS